MYNGNNISRGFCFSIMAPGSSTSLFRFTKSWNVQFSTIESYSSSRSYGNTPLYAYQPSNSVLGQIVRLGCLNLKDVRQSPLKERVETVYIIYSTQSYFISVIKKGFINAFKKCLFFVGVCLLLVLRSLFILTVDNFVIFELKFIMKFFKNTF